MNKNNKIKNVNQSLSDETEKQIRYRDARAKDWYDDIWKTVGKCVFCDLNEKYVFFEENGIVMTISLYAYIDGHFMIIPRRHVKSAKELSQKEWDTIRKFFYIAKKLVKKAHGINGMQIVQKDGVAAQSTVEHIHFHCIPFDQPDLCKWNYRTLKYTPLENVALYKKERKEIAELNFKYADKYENKTALPIVCDLIIENEKRQILFQERKKEYKFTPDILTLPGGTVDDYSHSLEDELAREVFEETNLKIDIAQLELVSSAISLLKRAKSESHLKIKYLDTKKFLRNTYRLKKFDLKAKLKAGDDCEALVWINKDEIQKHERISEETKKILL